MKVLACALLLATSTLAAQEPVDSGPLPRYPKAWIAVSADVGGVGEGPNLTTSMTIGGRAALAWRFAHHGVLQAEAARSTTSNQPQQIATTCTDLCAGTVGTDYLNSVTSGAVLLGYLRGSFGTSSMLLAAGPAFVRLDRQIEHRVSGVGIEASVDQTLVQGSRASITLHVSPVLVPAIESRMLWFVPVGVGVRFW